MAGAGGARRAAAAFLPRAPGASRGDLPPGLDVALTIGWIYYFAVGQPLIAIIYLGIDLIHALITTVLLLTGSFKDGKGRTVCYPGQTTK